MAYMNFLVRMGSIQPCFMRKVCSKLIGDFLVKFNQIWKYTLT